MAQQLDRIFDAQRSDHPLEVWAEWSDSRDQETSLGAAGLEKSSETIHQQVEALPVHEPTPRHDREGVVRARLGRPGRRLGGRDADMDDGSGLPPVPRRDAIEGLSREREDHTCAFAGQRHEWVR
jgi:hypothetical protein